jgi:hypothetical protein
MGLLYIPESIQKLDKYMQFLGSHVCRVKAHDIQPS